MFLALKGFESSGKALLVKLVGSPPHLLTAATSATPLALPDSGSHTTSPHGVGGGLGAAGRKAGRRDARVGGGMWLEAGKTLLPQAP